MLAHPTDEPSIHQELAVSLKRPILLLLIPAIAACDSQVDGNHNGTAL